MAWMETIPRAVVRACARMLPRLTAEESFLAVQRGALAAGTLKPHIANGIVREWVTAARADGQQAKPSKRAFRAALKSVGLSVGPSKAKRRPAPDEASQP